MREASSRHADGRSTADLLAAVLLAVASGFTIFVAGDTYFWGDEALHTVVSSQPTALAVHRTVLQVNTHPTSYYILLHAWKQVGGDSEFWLRSLSILQGIAGLALIYAWARTRFDAAAGLATLGFLTGSASLLGLFAEVRQYGQLFLLIGGALLALERSLSRGRPAWMVASGVLLGLSVLTLYSAMWLLPGFGLYVLLRLRAESGPRALTRAAVASFLLLTATVTYAYSSHMRYIHGGWAHRQAITTWLKDVHYDPGRESVPRFLARHTVGVGDWMVGLPPPHHHIPGALVLGLFGLGLWALARRRDPSVFLLTLPFATFGVMAVLGHTPYGGTRHCAGLLPFAAAAAGCGASRLLRGKLASVAALCVLQLALAGAILVAAPPSGPRHFRKPADMAAAVAEIKRSVPPGSVILVDKWTLILLAHYLGKDAWSPTSIEIEDLSEHRFGGFRVVYLKRWQANRKAFGPVIESYRAARPEDEANAAWIFSAGEDYGEAAKRGFAGVEGVRYFGPSIALVPARMVIAHTPAP